jgi:hypothetical protein
MTVDPYKVFTAEGNDVWDILGDGTPSGVAERFLEAIMNYKRETGEQIKSLSLDELVLVLSREDGDHPSFALRRVAQAVEAGEIELWHDGDEWMVTDDKHEGLRLLLRYLFFYLISDMENRTDAAESDLRGFGEEEAIRMLDEQYRKPIVDPLAEALLISRRMAFIILSCDTPLTNYADESHEERNFRVGAARLLAKRVPQLRRRHQSLES